MTVFDKDWVRKWVRGQESPKEIDERRYIRKIRQIASNIERIYGKDIGKISE